jgi:hypothetical protein
LVWLALSVWLVTQETEVPEPATGVGKVYEAPVLS